MARQNGYDRATFSTKTDDEEERKETDKLRTALFADFTTFLLNNILMSVQFFDNYEREMMQLRETCLEETTLDSGHFRVFDADTLHKLISSKVTYQRSVTGKKAAPEHLQPLRTYVTYQNVELANNVSSLGAKKTQYNPSYRLVVQRCEDDRKEVSGYVNVIAPPMLTEENPEMSFGGGTLIYHPDDHDEENKDPMKKPIQSGVLLSKNDTFFMLEPGKRSKPYPLTNYRTYERIPQLAAIPNSCFKDHEKQFTGNQRRRVGVVLAKTRKGKIAQKILVSAAFKRHFSEVFASHLASHFDLDKARLDTATFHLDRIIVRKQHAVHHVIPLLEMKEWPYGIPTEFFKEGNERNAVQWPTKTMQKTINKLGCSLVPLGFYEPTDENTDYTLEWKIEFPKAEKYLAVHMMHTHIRCYLFTLILYKTFIGTDESAPHFGPSHILNLLFLMVRKNFLAWPEYNQGETLTRYLRILEKTLQKKCLKSFFLSNRNLYDNSPQRVLHKAQTMIARILQNPIAYILKAFLNLKYKDETYPQLDYLKLYNILTVKNLMQYLHPEPPKKLKTRKNQAQPEPEPPALGRDTINEEELVTANNTPLYREEVLRLFIEHFINVANHSRKNGNYDNSMLYLVHARRLTMILSEESAVIGDIQDFNERIHNGILHCTKTGMKNDDKTGTIPPTKDTTNAKPGGSLRKPLLNPYVTEKKQEMDESTRM